MTITTIDARITVILLCVLVFGLNPKASGQAISQRLPDRYFTERDSCCNQAWLGGLFPVFSSNSILNDSVVFDDGTGPAVYFVYSEMIGNELANGVIKWDGTNWSSVGDGPGSGQINLITVLDDGSGPAIYIAGGFFTNTTFEYIARWNGVSWSLVGEWSSAPSDIYSLVAFDDGNGTRLYAGGSMRGEYNALAVLDGEHWKPLEGGIIQTDSIVDTVRRLVVHDDGTGPALYCAGTFKNAGGIDVNNFARWDGQTWTGLGYEGGRVRHMLTFHNGEREVLVLGDRSLFMWDGTHWTTIFESQDRALTDIISMADPNSDSELLYVAGIFFLPGETQRITYWDGNEWLYLPNNQGIVEVDALHSIDLGDGPSLYAYGDFEDVNGHNHPFARWNGETWDHTNSDIDGPIYSVLFVDGEPFSEPVLVIGGDFTTVPSDEFTPASRVAVWNGTEWSALGDGVNDAVRAMIIHDDGSGPALFVAGSFTMAGGVPANRIAKWDGEQWSALDAGLNAAAFALEVFDEKRGDGEALYAGGGFTTAGELPASRIAKWDGENWSPLGSGTNGVVRSLRVFDDGSSAGPALYVGGGFTLAGGVAGTRGIAKWDSPSKSVGGEWAPVRVGEPITSGSVRTMVLHDDGSGPVLFVGGDFNIARSQGSVRGLVKWDGLEWQSVRESGSSNQRATDVTALASYDDGLGNGPALYVANRSQVSLYPFEHRDYVMRWNGEYWSSLGSSVNDHVHALATMQYGSTTCLVVGGDFQTAGGKISHRLAIWSGCSPEDPFCAADLNCDGLVNLADFNILAINYGSSNASRREGDIVKNRTVDIADFNLLSQYFGNDCR